MLRPKEEKNVVINHQVASLAIDPVGHTPTHLHLGLRMELERVLGMIVAVVASCVSIVVKSIFLGGRKKREISYLLTFH